MSWNFDEKSPIYIQIAKHIKMKIISQEIGGDIQTYINYTRSSVLILAGPSLMAVFAIHSRTLLLFAAPFFLISLIIFITTFVALGHNL